MKRYFVKFCYKGTNYHGWQLQPNAISIQEILQNSFKLLFKKDIELIAAGRTDAGVHAKVMYAHFDYEFEIDKKIIQKFNSFLPKDIAILDFIEVQNSAHARFDAVKRTYQYHLHTYKNPFIEEYSWYYFQKLSVKKMNDAAAILKEYQDFECFSKTHTDVFTFNCKIENAHWEEKRENELVFTITADRFLRNMVRAIVGTLINIGIEKKDIQSIRQIIESKNRSEAGFSVPAHGLYLTQIEYPKSIFL